MVQFPRLRLNIHHKRAVWLLIGVIVMDVVSGLVIAATENVPVWHGIYCTSGLTTTDGCDIPFTSTLSYVMAWVAMILFVPLWSAVFSFFTSGLTADHVDALADGHTADIKKHVSALTATQTQQIKDHVDGST